MQLVHADVFPGHVRLDRFAVMYQQRRLPLDPAAEEAIRSGEIGNQIVENEQRAGRHCATEQRGVGAGHSVLYGVGEQEQQCQVEGSHLSDLTFPAKAYTNQDEQINYPGAEHDLQQHVSAGGKCLAQLAVTGTGAFFGVLRYPVALFLSTVQTTNSNSRWSRPE